jgi:Kef-type K+ transport system membrane component KefB
MHVIGGPFGEIATLLALAAGVGLLALQLRQPLIVAFIFVGLLAGPSALGWVHAHDEIDLLAQLGVAVLLFVVGLKLDLTLVRHLGPVALATGVGQLVFTIVFGFLLALGLGMDWVKAVYVAVALTFSSTIIIVKLLSDKREIDSLHGRIAVGFLIVQDIAVVIAMMVVGSWTTGGAPWTVAATIALKLAAALALVGVLMRYVLPPLLAKLARSQELLLVFGIAWGVLLAAAGEWVGFSREVGAFLAGFSLASTQYREALSTRLTTVRDFLLLFFFIDLGAKLDLATLGGEVVAALVFSAFVLIGNPLIVMVIMGVMGYRKRTGFLAGLTVAQISEFSIVFVAMGISLGHVASDALGLVTLVGLITITTVDLHDPVLGAAVPAPGALARRVRARAPAARGRCRRPRARPSARRGGLRSRPLRQPGGRGPACARHPGGRHRLRSGGGARAAAARHRRALRRRRRPASAGDAAADAHPLDHLHAAATGDQRRPAAGARRPRLPRRQRGHGPP